MIQVRLEGVRSKKQNIKYRSKYLKARCKKKEITDTEAIKLAITHAVVEVEQLKAELATNGEDKRQSINVKHSCVPKATRHRTGPKYYVINDAEMVSIIKMLAREGRSVVYTDINDSKT